MASSSSNFQSIFNASLQAYDNKTSFSTTLWPVGYNPATHLMPSSLSASAALVKLLD
jgi:hypothetical protein